MDAKLDQRMDGILYLPDFTFGPPSVGRRVHYDCIIAVASSDLTLHEFYAVIHNPADGRVGQAGRCRVFLGPAHHALGGVHVGDTGPGLGGRQGGAAGVGKEVEDLNWPSGLPYPPAEPIPVGGLLREQPCVLKAEGLQVECKPFVTNGPLFRQIKKFPLAPAFAAAVVVAVHVFPAFMALRGIPDNLRVRPDQQISAPSFQFFAL